MSNQAIRKVKLSKYTNFVAKEDSTYIVSNNLNGTIVHINECQTISELEDLLCANKSGKLIYNSESELHQYLYKTGIFLDSDVNEYELAMYTYERNIVRDSSMNLILITSRQCNLRCLYCYENLREQHMSEEIYTRLLSFIRNKIEQRECSSLNVSLFGGEPFYQFDVLLKFLNNAKHICDDFGVSFTVGATTNFTLVTPERLKLLDDVGCKTYQITIDGLQETHDKYRPDILGQGSYSRIIENMVAVKQSGYDFRIIIRSNFNEEFVGQAGEFYKMMKAEFDDPRFMVHFENIKKLGGNNDEALEILDDSKSIESIAAIMKLVSSLRIKNVATDVFTLPFQGVCYASKHNTFVFDHDGSIRKCTLNLDDDKGKIGSLLENGELSIDHEKHACWVCKSTKLTQGCEECQIFPICFGGRCAATPVYGTGEVCNEQLKQQRLKIVENSLKYCVR